MQATSADCKPFPNPSLYVSGVYMEMMSIVYNQYLPQHRVDAVLLAARWKVHDLPEIAAVVKNFREMNIPVVVIGPAEEYDTPLPILLAYAIRSGDPSMPFPHRLVDLEELDKSMQNEAAQAWHVRYISLIQADCGPADCHEYADDARSVPQIFDHDHYTTEGATVLVARLVAQGKFNF